MFKSSCITVGAMVAAMFSGHVTAQGAQPAAPSRAASAVQAIAPASQAMGTAPTAELKLKVPTDQGRGTIATITDLAQQLKVEQLKRDVREARMQQGGGEGATMKASPGSFGMPPPAVPVSMKVHASEKQPPTVVAILGLGGRLRARLSDGRDLLAGQEASGWTVRGITPSSVSFEHCSSEKARGAKAETTCISRTVPPVPM